MSRLGVVKKEEEKSAFIAFSPPNQIIGISCSLDQNVSHYRIVSRVLREKLLLVTL